MQDLLLLVGMVAGAKKDGGTEREKIAVEWEESGEGVGGWKPKTRIRPKRC